MPDCIKADSITDIKHYNLRYNYDHCNYSTNIFYTVFSSIINVNDLKENLDQPDWVVVDTRYDLADIGAGKKAYLDAHIPGALFADINDDLSGPPLTDHGRHPLPSAEQLNRLFSRLGINNNTQVVVYDQVSGSFAGRLWWLLRYMGHEQVAVLNGGWQMWEKAGFPVRSGEETRQQENFLGVPRSDWLITVDQIPASRLLVDSRDPVRYRGDSEPLDRAAGHIPGAINHFWKDNLDENGLFKSPEIIHSEFKKFLGSIHPEEAVFYCGSGVTACHNLLAAAFAGLPVPKLYAGSWSDWCSDTTRSVVVGGEPGHFEK